MIRPISGCAIAYLLSELSIPWNREQTDRMMQVITEAGPRYQINMPGPVLSGPAFLFCAVRANRLPMHQALVGFGRELLTTRY